jgi:hypothetical protein
MERCFVFFEVRTEFLSTIQMNFGFKGLKQRKTYTKVKSGKEERKTDRGIKRNKEVKKG